MRLKEFLINYEENFQKINPNTIVLSILAITLLVFSPVFMGAEFLTYDDNWYIYENKHVIDFSWSAIVEMFSSPLAGQYSPLGEVYNAFLYMLFGDNASAFKIAGVIVHLFSVFLLFNILKNLFDDKILVSLVTILFAIHPMQVETIGWLSVMFRNSVLFMFLGYFLYFKYLDNNFGKLRLLPVVACYIIACLFKEQAILFSVGVFLINMKRFDFKFNKRIIIETAFWGFLALSFGLFTLKIMRVGGPSLTGRTVSVIEKFDVLSKTVLEYCYNFVLPLNLSFSYPYPLSKSDNFLLTAVLALIVIGTGIFFAIKYKVFRFGFLWLLGFLSLSLALSFFSIRDTYMADRYVYVAIIGFSVIFYFILVRFIKPILPKKLFLPILFSFSIFCAFISFNRVSVFKNNKTLWANALEVNPENQYANNSLGYYYRKANDYEKAERHYKRAIAIDSNYFLAHNNLGYVYSKQKKFDKAIIHFSKAISINRNYKNAYENRAALAKEINNNDLLLVDLRKLLEFAPKNVGYREEIVKAYFKKKRHSKVIEEAILLLRYDSDNRVAISHMGQSYFHLQKYKEAIPLITSIIPGEKNKGYYFFIRSVSYYQIGDLSNALKDLQSAQKLNYKVNKNYLNLIVREVKKINN